MNKIEILELYVYRQSIKKCITQNYCITLNPADKLPRGEVLSTIISELNLTKNNKTQLDISTILQGLGVERGILSGRKDWRGITRLS